MIESNENGTICENMAPDSIERQWSLIRETQMRTVRCHVSFNGSTIAQSQQCFFFLSKIVFIFRVSSVLFSLEFSWLPSQKHIASQRIIDVWAKYNGKGVDRLVISCFIDNSSYIAMMYVCISMAALCSDDAQTIINNQRNFAFSLVKFRNHLSIQHHMKNTYWHCYFHFVLRQLAGFNGVKKQMKLK